MIVELFDSETEDVIEGQKNAIATHNATAEYALKMIDLGYRFVTLASDSRFLAAKAATEVAAVRRAASKGKLPAY